MVVLDQQKPHPFLILPAKCLGMRVLAKILYIVLNSQLLGKRQQTFVGKAPTQKIPLMLRLPWHGNHKQNAAVSA